MKRNYLEAEYISFLCSQMELILRAGIATSEALPLLAEDEQEGKTPLAEVVEMISKKLGEGYTMSEAFQATERFPRHVTDMIKLGEETGYLEKIFGQLTKYYDRGVRIRAQFKRAVTYPLMIGFMMLCVIGILIVKVMPMFKSVYDQVGGNMSGFARAFLDIGVFLGNHIVGTIVISLLLLIAVSIGIYADLKRGVSHIPFIRRMRRKSGAARFAAAISMGISSGLDADDSINLVSDIEFDNDTFNCIEKAKDSISRGDSFADAMTQTGLFPALYCRMLNMGYRSGNIDSVMQEIAERMDEALSEEIDSILGRVEPALVMGLSVLTGLILMSVMLPLMNIMATIG